MRRSPLHAQHAPHCAEWITINGMAMPSRYESGSAAEYVVLADVSCGMRAGLKGSGASAWLASRGIAVPGRPNSWIRTDAGSLIARLGETEFLLEDMQAPGIASAVGNELSGAPGDVYPVLRQDLSLLLHGQRAASVLLETCSLDFRDLKTERGDLALTSMLGVSVLVVPVGIVPAAYRIWADPSFGPYLWDTLLDIVASHGGGAAGWSQLDARCLV